MSDPTADDIAKAAQRQATELEARLEAYTAQLESTLNGLERDYLILSVCVIVVGVCLYLHLNEKPGA